MKDGRSEPEQAAHPTIKPTRRITFFDIVAVTLLIAIAAAWHCQRWMGIKPFVLLDSDAAQIASFAAGWDHYELLEGDPLLGDPQTFRFYVAAHIPILRILARIVGDYGSAFLWLLGPHAFLMGLGFYILGKLLFHSRYWAFLLALLNLTYVSQGSALVNGLQFDALPNFCFNALLPYLLAGAVYYRTRPKVWPLLMIAAGLLLYIHPNSGPPIGFAVWFGLWIFLPASWGWFRKLRYMFVLGLVFLATIAPFTLYYQSTLDAPPVDPEDAKVFQEAITARLNPAHFSIQRAVSGLVTFWLSKGVIAWIYWVGAVLGFLIVLICRKERKPVVLVGLWAVGLLLISVGIPWADMTLSKMAGRTQSQLLIGLWRPIKYLLPLMYILFLWPFAEMWQRLKRTPHPQFNHIFGLFFLGLGFVGAWVYLHPQIVTFPVPTFKAWMAGKPLFCTGGAPLHAEAVQAVAKHTPPGSRVFATTHQSDIRSIALRPVVYAYKDGGSLAFSNTQGAVRWYKLYQRLGRMGRGYDEEKYKKCISVARELGAQYFFASVSGHRGSDDDLEQALGVDLVWRNSLLGLFRLAEVPDSQAAPAEGSVKASSVAKGG